LWKSFWGFICHHQFSYKTEGNAALFSIFWNVLEWWLNPSNVPMKAPASEGPYSHKRTIHLTENVPISSVLRLCAGVILQASELQDFFHRILKWRLVTGIRRIWYDTHDGSMVLLYIYMVTWILSIYPSHVSIYTSTMDPSCDMIWYDMVSTDLYFFGATNRNNTSPASRFRPSAIIKRVTVRIKTSFKMSYPETRWFIKTNLSFKTSPDHQPSNNLRILMQAPSRKWFPWTSRNLALPEAQAECKPSARQGMVEDGPKKTSETCSTVSKYVK